MCHHSNAPSLHWPEAHNPEFANFAAAQTPAPSPSLVPNLATAQGSIIAVPWQPLRFLEYQAPHSQRQRPTKVKMVR